MSDLTHRLEAAGQSRLAASLDALEGPAREHLAAQCEALDLALVSRLVDAFVRAEAPASVPADIGPARVDRLPSDDAGVERRREAREAGEAALRAGRVAVVLLAGGDGTRLGLDAPKGVLSIGPVSNASLFEIHAAGVAATRQRYACDLPWFLMTSPGNDADTIEFLDQHALFGLMPGSVRTFVQGTMPVVDRVSGDILREAPDRLALSPDGHGGILRAMGQAGIPGELEERGIDVIMTFQVDNPLMRVADPELIGAHVLARAEMSTLVVAKVAPEERMGVMATVDGRTALVEYSDLPSHLGAACEADGSLTYWAGSTGVHCLDRDFARRLAVGEVSLPFHRADKQVPFVADDGSLVDPPEPNAAKFESFMFDALPLAERTATVEVARAERFSPVKNADGADSPATARRHMVARAAGWLDAAGVTVPRDAAGDSAVPIEIDPRYALDAEALAGRVQTDLAISAPLLLR